MINSRKSKSQTTRTNARKIKELENLEVNSQYTMIEVLQGDADYVEALEMVEYLRVHERFPNKTLSRIQNAMTYGDKWNQSDMSKAVSLCEGAKIVIQASQRFNRSEQQILISGLTGKGTTRKFRESCRG